MKSGTSTLEAALERTPFVVAYRTSPINYFLARRLVSLDRIALANLVAGEDVVPEAIQRDANPEHLAELLLPLLEPDSPRRSEMVRRLEKVRDALGEAGAANRVAEVAAELLGDPVSSGPSSPGGSPSTDTSPEPAP